jgi:hypothetical protein
MHEYEQIVKNDGNKVFLIIVNKKKKQPAKKNHLLVLTKKEALHVSSFSYKACICRRIEI